MTQAVVLYVLDKNMSASMGQCRPCVCFFEQMSTSSVSDVCIFFQLRIALNGVKKRCQVRRTGW